MITKPTVLVLGAGASSHVRYPLGSQLVNDICQNKGRSYKGEMPPHFSVEELDYFYARLSRGAYNSIDTFLGTEPVKSELGKYILARQMKSYENIDTLFRPNDSGWYHYLFNRLLGNNDVSGFESSYLSIVTFNYDRSLEVYLH